MKATLTAKEACDAVSRVTADIDVDKNEMMEKLGKVNELLNQTEISAGVRKGSAEAREALYKALRAANEAQVQLRSLERQLSVLPQESTVELAPAETALLSYARKE